MRATLRTADGPTLSYERRGRGPLLAGLRATAAPTLGVGDDDTICGPACAQAMVREPADVKLVTTGDSGHVVYVEQPAASRATPTGFLP